MKGGERTYGPVVDHPRQDIVGGPGPETIEEVRSSLETRRQSLKTIVDVLDSYREAANVFGMAGASNDFYTMKNLVESIEEELARLVGLLEESRP